MKTRFIVNVRSGRAQSVLAAVQAFAASRGAQLVRTERAQHGKELAAEALADGCELIVAVGGDGTMNEVASALVGSDATFGLIPCGSGDGLGRHLRIHGAVGHALDVLERGRPRLIDSGTADGHLFFTVAGIGFEAEIASRFNRLEHRGLLRYLTTSASAFHSWQPLECRITHQAGITAFRTFTIAVANSDQYGNGALIASGARIDDGRLNLTAIPPFSLASGLPLLVRLFWGKIEDSPGVLALCGTRFVIERDEPGLLHTDGELHEAGRAIEFQIRPASLRILAPAS